jgi:hypothetical protein
MYEYSREERGIETSEIRILRTLAEHRPHRNTERKGIIEIHEEIKVENISEAMKKPHR